MTEPPVRMRLEALSDKLNALSTELAIVSERQQQGLREQHATKVDIEELAKRLATIEQSALKTAGGFAVIMALGAVGGWVLASWQSLVALFRGVK